MSFFVVYRDQSGEFAVLVDETQVTPIMQSYMLSNKVTIELQGIPEFIKVCCKGFDDECDMVDELFVNPVEPIPASIIEESMGQAI